MLVSTIIKKKLSPYNSLFPRQSPLYCRIYAKYIPGDDKHSGKKGQEQKRRLPNITESEQEALDKARRKPRALQGYDEELMVLATQTYSSNDESDDEDQNVEKP